MSSGKLDWSKLPDGLDYLISCADRFGAIQFDEQVDEFIKTAPEEERAELKMLAIRLWKETDDGHSVVDWLRHTSIVEHPEAARVYFLLNLLNAMGYA